jgi:SAM-dependent methyltransferase
MTPATDSSSRQKQTLSSETLRLRQDVYDRYSVPQIDYHGWVLDRLRWRGDEHVLDVGCGPGDYYQALTRRYPEIDYVGVDLSPEMLESNPARPDAVQADIGGLPFASDSFDVVMANHILFLIQDRDQAISELRRVLKPDGVLLASTNSIHTMPEFQALMRRALVLLGASGKGQVQPPQFPHHSFSLENGTRQLAEHFFAVVRYDLPTALVFPSIDPIISFLDSTRIMREPYLPEDITWDDLMMVMREQMAALLTHFGELVINKISGVLVASDAGGFIQDFVGRQNGHHTDDGTF